KGKVLESLVNVATTLSSDAKTMANLTLEILRNNGLDSKRLLSQCYDGTSVMSGRKGGVQTLIQEKLHPKVPTVQCSTEFSGEQVVQSTDAFSGIVSEAKSRLLHDENDMSRPIRRKKANCLYNDYILTESTTKEHDTLESLLIDTIHITCREFERRFFENNMLLQAVDSIEESDIDKLYPLSELGISLPSIEELSVVKKFMKDKMNILEELYKYRQPFNSTYNLFATVATFGCSTSICESSFSVLTRVSRPQRNMSGIRCSNLVFLAFESRYTKKMDIEKFLLKFSRKKDRRLRLF
ncbi:Zinc finger MYM-type protein 1-like, partial [Oopsacas minuta]